MLLKCFFFDIFHFFLLIFSLILKGYGQSEENYNPPNSEKGNNFPLRRRNKGPIDISSSSALERNRGGGRGEGEEGGEDSQQGSSTMNPMFASLHSSSISPNNNNNININNNSLYDVGRRRVSEVTVVTDSRGGYSMRHESIGSQDSDNNSYSTNSTQDPEAEEENIPHPGRFIRSLSEAMRPENFDLLSGEYHVKGGGRGEIGNSKKGVNMKGVKGSAYDGDDNIKPWSASEAMRKAAFGSSSLPNNTNQMVRHSTNYLPNQPTLPSQPSPTTVPIVPTSGRPPVGPIHQSSVPQLPLDFTKVIPQGSSPTLGSGTGAGTGVISGMGTGMGTGIAEGMGRTKVPFDGSTPLNNNDPQTGQEDGLSARSVTPRKKKNERDNLIEGEVSDREGSEKEGAISMEGDPTLREWMKTAQVISSSCICFH